MHINEIVERNGHDRTRYGGFFISGVKALSAPHWREPKEVSGSACLPQVGLFAAGHRKSENITAR